MCQFLAPPRYLATLPRLVMFTEIIDVCGTCLARRPGFALIESLFKDLRATVKECGIESLKKPIRLAAFQQVEDRDAMVASGMERVHDSGERLAGLLARLQAS